MLVSNQQNTQTSAAEPFIVYPDLHQSAVQQLREQRPAMHIYRLYPTEKDCIFHQNIKAFLEVLSALTENRDASWTQWMVDIAKGWPSSTEQRQYLMHDMVNVALFQQVDQSILSNNTIVIQHRDEKQKQAKKEDEMSALQRLLYFFAGSTTFVVATRSLVHDMYMLSLLRQCHNHLGNTDRLLESADTQEYVNNLENPHFCQLVDLEQSVQKVMPYLHTYHKYKGICKMTTIAGGATVAVGGLLGAPVLVGVGVVIGVPSLAGYFGIKRWYSLLSVDKQLHTVEAQTKSLLSTSEPFHK